MVIEDYKQLKALRGLQRKAFYNKRLVNKNARCRCLVLLHLYYDQSWKEISEYLKNLAPYQFDLAITVTKNLIGQDTIYQIKNEYPDVKIVLVDNKGYDLLPFFALLKDVDLDNYDIVFKLHSKSTKRKHIYIYKQLFCRRDWFLNLYEGILSGKNVHKTIDVLFNQKETGLVAAKKLIVKDPKYKNHLIERIAEEKNIEIVKDYSFAAGTCFAVKAECLKPIQSMHFENAEFLPQISSRGMSFAHFLERYLCISVLLQGYQIKGNTACSLKRLLVKPMTGILNHYSSERLYDEEIDLDDEWFYWQMDNRLIIYRFEQIKISDIKYNDNNRYFSFLEGAPYKYIKTGDVEGYEKYCAKHRTAGLPIMTKERFDHLIESINQKGFDERKVIIIDHKNGLLDGQHRACVLACKYGEEASVRVLKIWDITKIIHGMFKRD